MKKYVYHFTVLQITGLLLLLSHFSHVRLCATPQTAAHQASLSLRFSRQEHWSGLPFPSPMHESEVAQSYPTLSNTMDCSPPGPSIHGIPQARGLEWAATASSHPWSYYMLIPNFEDRGKEQERGNILIYKFCLKIHSGVMQNGELTLEKGMATHPSILPGKSHGERSLAGYSPWGRKNQSDTTQQLNQCHHHTCKT